MKTLTALGVLVLIVFLGAMTAPALAAPEAKGGFSVTVDPSTLHSGQVLTATGRYSASCVWIITWNNERRTTTAKRIVATFVAPKVTKATRIPLQATCFYVSKVSARPTPPKPSARPNSTSQRITVMVPPSLRQTITVTVLPSGTIVSPPTPGGGGGGLPNTGGPDLWILLAGIATLLVGASMVRHAPPEELPFPMS